MGIMFCAADCRPGESDGSGAAGVTDGFGLGTVCSSVARSRSRRSEKARCKIRHLSMKEASEDAETNDLSSTGLQIDRCWPPFRMVRIVSADFLKSRHEARASLSAALWQGSQPASAASTCGVNDFSSKIQAKT